MGWAGQVNTPCVWSPADGGVGEAIACQGERVRAGSWAGDWVLAQGHFRSQATVAVSGRSHDCGGNEMTSWWAGVQGTVEQGGRTG